MSVRQTAASARVEELRQLLTTTYADWGAGPLTGAGSGLEFLVCRATTAKFGTVALKTPWQRWIANDNDAQLDARDLLQQEALLTAYVGSRGIQVPTVYHLHLDDQGSDFLVSAFLASDQSEPDMQTFGQLIRQLHTLPPPGVNLVAQGPGELHATLAARIAQRAQVVATKTGTNLAALPADHLLRLLNGYANPQRRLLHMDARPANLLTHNGQILGLVDWSNALIGDPALELARIAECGYLTPEFLQGYGVAEPFAHLPKAVEVIYRLDTAIMLGVVFLSEAPDEALAQAQVERVQSLYNEFLSVTTAY